MSPRHAIVFAALILCATRCALYTDVTIQPLIVSPEKIERGADIHSMLRKADYLRAVGMASSIEARQRPNATDLLALGTAELASARFDSARKHLRTALDLSPDRQTYAEIAWALSQIEYLTNSYATSLEWARLASQSGLTVLQWHLEYLEAMSSVPAYRFGGMPSDEIQLFIGRPDVPRVNVRINREGEPHSAVIDSGAVLSIMSERLAATTSIRILPIGRGTFYGLLGEPILVRFGLLDSLELGAVVVENVPVAIMPDEKMRFVVRDRKEFHIDLLLGANLLKEFRMELNFSRNRATFTRLTSRDRNPAPDQNLFFDNFRPHVRGTVNRHGWFLFVIDTGSEVTYLNEAQMSRLPINSFAPRVHSATLQGLGGAKKRGAKIENVELGFDRWAGVFRTIPMYSAGEHDRSIGIIGQNFLQKFNVVMDFGTMRLNLSRR
ncbi:MAG TPA: retroviral-like aspartic protease family protein [Thermoanaerobaculia bacterium]|nr:retroviral-like aspartic protease family protein [Thermoanaerobaculia bacterium]